MKTKKKTPSRTDEPWSDISAKLDTLIRLSALNVVKDLKTQKEQIATLSDAGFGPTDIADILKTTSNTVNVALSAIRKEGTSAKPEEPKKEISAETSEANQPTETKPVVKEDAQES